MTVRLYFDAMSQPSRALLIFLRANSKTIPSQEMPVALRKGEHLAKEFEQINPFKKVPAIEHDGFKLTESVAILRYLCRTFPVADHWYPKDSQKQARVDEYMAWQHLNLRAFGSMVFQTKVIIPAMTGEPVNEKRLQSFQTRLADVLETMENIWLKENPYVAGQELSIADLLAATELEQPGMAGYDVCKDRPRIAAYMEAVKNKLQPHYEDAHSIVYKIKSKALKARL